MILLLQQPEFWGYRFVLPEVSPLPTFVLKAEKVLSLSIFTLVLTEAFPQVFKIILIFTMHQYLKIIYI